MATTDARPGFKLPWSSDRHESDSTVTTEPVTPAASEADQPTGNEPTTGDVEATVQDAAEATPVATREEPFDPWRLGATRTAEAAPKRKPNKLMADLTRAMQSAAESARDETLERLQADAKAFIESIHARSGSEAEELRHAADTDVSAIRDWSKAEIARIREETDSRIAARKAALESEIEEHAARIEQRIERVQAHVAWFETEMAGFFERLLAEDDPTRLAVMAESLPEPPTFQDADLADLPDLPPRAAVEAAVEEATPDAQAEPDAQAGPEAQAEEAAAPQLEEAAAPQLEESAAPPEDPDAAFAAIQAAAEAAEAEATTVDAEPTETVTDAIEVSDQAEAVDSVETGPTEAEADEADEADPRLSALGLSAEAAAEAEAEATREGGADEIATFSDDALAARLAGLVPAEGEAVHADLRATRVLVTGLVSVASIASFKRQLGRLEGVSSVGVSSGPDGEFIFAVNHAPDVSLRDAIPTLSGFAARVTDTTDDTVTVAARDPETEA
jgi:hypothetical protein